MREIKFRNWDKKNKKMFYNTCANDANEFPERFKVMQYTGLHDKNGKEIYESDIVQVKDQGKAEIKMLEGCWVTDSDYMEDCGSLFGWLVPLEVIGNIYETRKLLEKHDQT